MWKIGADFKHKQKENIPKTTCPGGRAASKTGVNMYFLNLTYLISWNGNVATKQDCGNFLMNMINNSNSLQLTAFYDSHSASQTLICKLSYGGLVKMRYQFCRSRRGA